MSIADELTRLEELRRSGALSDDEFARAKEAVLSGASAPADAEAGRPGGDAGLAAHLAEVRAQNELARIDREWNMERERYMIYGRYGRRYIPTPGTSVAIALAIAVIGVFWTVMASWITSGFKSEFPDGHGPPTAFATCFPLFGVLFTVAGIAQGIWAYKKAHQYREAEAAYRARRARALAAPSR